MAECGTIIYKKQKRRESRSNARQAIFISDYLKFKHSHIYEEAAQEYNYLNQLYPRKPDLRRSLEYRVWKNNIAKQQSLPPSKIPRQKFYKYNHAPYSDIPVSSGSSTSLPYTQNPVSETEKVMQLRILLMALSPASTQPTEIIAEEVIQTSTETGEAPTKPTEIIAEEVIQTSTETGEAPTEPTEIIAEEVIQTSTEEVIYPSLVDELAPEIVDSIIAELRKDSDLKGIFTEMEQQVQMEEADLDIDIPDPSDPLEDELMDLLW